ncbi:MAG: trehalose-phosphatase [Acidimicrobiia bacterium]|nr:trehalose-phosphatase [Acidimicrobiia bacterium]
MNEALARFAGPGHILCAFDFDGTLSEIVLEPDDATPVPGAVEALEKLVSLEGVEVAVLSGRIHHELQERLHHPDLVLIGEHGSDHGHNDPDGLAPLQDLIDDLGKLVAAAPGSRLEVKSKSVVLHTRNVLGNVKDALATRAKSLVDEGSEIVIMEGKEVVEFSVSGADKGSAMVGLAERLGTERTLYVGDDVTDEDAFSVLGDDDLGIKVGTGETRADYLVPDPSAVVGMMERLVELRKAEH